MPHRNFWSRNVSKKAQREIAATATAAGVDARAVNILFNAFFDEDDENMSWVEKLDVPKADYAEAKAAGLMFDPIKLEHDEFISWVLDARDQIEPLAVSAAFAASLDSRRMDTRSALGSYAHVLHLARHTFEAGKRSSACTVCGASKLANKVDLSSRNFRRFKWAGNIEQGDLEYIGCDLQEFAKLKTVPQPEGGFAGMRGVLDAIRSLPKTAQLSELNKALAGQFQSNKHERQVVLEILGYAGVLKPKGWPCFFDGWVRPADRKEPSNFYKKEWQFPVSGWTGNDGINEEAVRFWFPQVG